MRTYHQANCTLEDIGITLDVTIEYYFYPGETVVDYLDGSACPGTPDEVEILTCKVLTATTHSTHRSRGEMSPQYRIARDSEALYLADTDPGVRPHLITLAREER